MPARARRTGTPWWRWLSRLRAGATRGRSQAGSLRRTVGRENPGWDSAPSSRLTSAGRGVRTVMWRGFRRQLAVFRWWLVCESGLADRPGRAVEGDSHVEVVGTHGTGQPTAQRREGKTGRPSRLGPASRSGPRDRPSTGRFLCRFNAANSGYRHGIDAAGRDTALQSRSLAGDSHAGRGRRQQGGAPDGPVLAARPGTAVLSLPTLSANCY